MSQNEGNRFAKYLMKPCDDFTIWFCQERPRLRSAPPFPCGLTPLTVWVLPSTRKWRKLQIFAARHDYVVLQIWRCGSLSRDQATILAETWLFQGDCFTVYGSDDSTWRRQLNLAERRTELDFLFRKRTFAWSSLLCVLWWHFCIFITLKSGMILVFSLRNVGGCKRVLVGECRVSVGAGWEAAKPGKPKPNIWSQRTKRYHPLSTNSIVIYKALSWHILGVALFCGNIDPRANYERKESGNKCGWLGWIYISAEKVPKKCTARWCGV